MIELSFDASAKSAGVSLILDQQVIFSKSIENGKTHSEELMVLIDEAFEKCQLDISDLDFIYVASGPGSFTGLRIAISVAKGLAHALSIPLFAISTLDALSYHAHETDAIVCPIMDARRSRVYTACYEGVGGKRLIEPIAISFDELAEKLCLLLEESCRKKIVFVGDGIEPYAHKIEELSRRIEKKDKRYSVAAFNSDYLSTSPVRVYKAAKTYSYNQLRYDEVVPVYLREPQAVREKNEKHKFDDKKRS